MKRWKGTINWFGELHEFETSALTLSKARTNIVYQFSKKFDISIRRVSIYLKSNADRWSVKEI